MKDSGRFKSAVLAAFISFHLFLAAPLFLYATNLSEFRLPLSTALGYLLPVFLLSFGLIFLGLQWLHKKARFRLLAVVAAGALYLYVQFFLLVRNYGILDGSPIDWNRHAGAGSLEIGLLALLLGGALFWGRRFLPAASFALVLLMAGEALTVAMELNRLRTESPSPAPHQDLPSVEELSPKKNVILLIIDTLQSDIFEEIAQEDPHLREQLNGFVFFRDAMGAFPFTYLSLQAILTGDHYEPGEAITDYVERVSNQYLHRLVNRRGGVSVHLDASNNIEYLTNLGAARRHELARLYDLVLFRQVPHLLKPWVLNDYSFRLSRRIAGPELGLPIQRDLEVLRNLSSNSFVGNQDLTFKVLHLWGSHLPVDLDSDCSPLPQASYDRQDYKEHSRCVLGRVVEYLNKLRRLDVYDQSMIFLLSDHGSIFPLSSNGENDGTIPDYVLSRAQATIAVKDFDSRGDFRISEAPGALVDVAPTVTAALGLPFSGQGRNLLALGEDDERTRRFYYFKSANEVLEDALTGVDEFEIKGRSRQRSSWTRGHRYSGELDELVEMIDFGTIEAAKHLGAGWSGIEVAEPTQSWSLVLNPSLYAVLPDRGSVQMNLRMRSFIPGQQVTLTLNGREIAEWEIPPDFQFRDYPTHIPLRPNERGTLSHFRFLITQEQQPNDQDPRKLGISIDWIRFE